MFKPQTKFIAMININTQINRLYTIHSRCKNDTDISNFLDLSHVLRIIIEHKDELTSILKDDSFFESELIYNHLKKITSKPKMWIIPISPAIVIQNTLIKNIFYIGESLTDEQLALITSPLHKFHKQKYSYEKYWGSQILHTRIKENSEIVSFTRLKLVERMANTLGASHKFNLITNESTPEDVVLNALFREVKVLEIPLPYLICYKISQEILDMCGFEASKH